MQETLASAHQSELGARWALAAAAGLNSLATSSRWPTQSIQLTYTVLLIPGETSGRSSMRSLRLMSRLLCLRGLQRRGCGFY